MECCIRDHSGFCVSPAFTSPDPECCEPVSLCFEEKPVLYCCKKKSGPKVVYSCDNKEVVYSCHKKPSGSSHHSEKKPPKVLYCCEKESPKVVYCCEKSAPPPKPCCEPACKPVKTKYIMPCYRYEDGRIFQERYVPTRHGTLPRTAYSRNGMQDQIHGYRGAVRYLCSDFDPKYGHCVHTVVEPLRTVFPKVTKEVEKLPVSAFKRNGMQDQEHSKLLGTVNFLVRCPQDVSVECNTCNLKVGDPVKVPCFMKKKPIKNQPTVLMRRACEVACGRRKPFVASSYHVDADHEESRYHSEDGKGNLCFHYERKKPAMENCCMPTVCCDPAHVPNSNCPPCGGRQFVSCLPAPVCSPPSCCYYSY